MNLLFATPECAPLAQTGGLGEVSAALPVALRELGIDARVLLPAYRGFARDAGCLAEMELLGRRVRLFESQLPTGVPIYLLDCPELFRRDGGPYQDAQGADWPDNALRFGVFSRAAALLSGGASPLDWRPDVLQCNDWPAALAPVFASFEPDHARTLLTIHNLAFQGNFDAQWVERLGLPESFLSMDRLEFHGRMSFLKGGIVCADALNTVSPRYAREIQGEEMGCGMEGLLRGRAADLRGILNGIDTSAWDPASDRFIAARYDAASLERKSANKAALQRRLNLEPDARALLLGSVGRMTHQKGSDLLAAAAAELLAGPAQLAVLGAGERDIERALTALAARHPGRMAVKIGFDDELAHLIEAGADLFLMPSRYEPCGLNQMYSQRYGTPPVARATGGLADTIQDGATGFLFERAEPAALLDAVRRAAALWREPPRWALVQRAAMGRDFSWAAAARRYADLYRQLATPARG
jgi:starch synthase